jgi:hypothetical protein
MNPGYDSVTGHNLSSSYECRKQQEVICNDAPAEPVTAIIAASLPEFDPSIR